MKKLFIPCISLLVALLSLSACSNDNVDEGQENSPVYHSNPIYLRFIGENGEWLTDNLPMEPGYPNSARCAVKTDAYSLTEKIDDGEENILHGNNDVYDEPLWVYPAKGYIEINPTLFMIRHNWRLYDHTATIKFTCPAIYGDDSEHVIVAEKAGKDLGYDHWIRITYDGEVLIENDYYVPLEVHVPNKAE